MARNGSKSRAKQEGASSTENIEVVKIMKKIHLFVNGQYVCRSNRYRTCKEFASKIKSAGVISLAGADPVKLERLEIKPTDEVRAHFAK